MKLIAIAAGDTLTFDYGYYLSTLTEYESVILPISYLTEMIKSFRDTSDCVFTGRSDTVAIEIKKQNVVLQPLGGFEAKIFFPGK